MGANSAWVLKYGSLALVSNAFYEGDFIMAELVTKWGFKLWQNLVVGLVMINVPQELLIWRQYGSLQSYTILTIMFVIYNLRWVTKLGAGNGFLGHN